MEDAGERTFHSCVTSFLFWLDGVLVHGAVSTTPSKMSHSLSMMCARQRDVDLREEESDLINLNEVTCRILEG